MVATARTDLQIGTCVVLDQLEQNDKLRTVIEQNYTYLTPEYNLQWSSFEPSPGLFQHRAVDGIVDFAASRGMAVHGHALLWEQMTPDWARQKLRSAKPDWRVIRERFRSTLERYGDSIHIWNVVNEPIDTENGIQGLRRNTFYNAFGPAYIARALETARELAPSAKLVINDYSLEYENPVDAERRIAVLRLVESLKKRGIPLDGFGMQGHLDLGKGPMSARSIRAFLNELEAFGLQIFITELDVQERDFSLPIEVRDQKVADEARRFLDIVLDQPGLVGVTTWGVSDQYSWLKPMPEDLAGILYSKRRKLVNRGLPYDVAMRPKPMSLILDEALLDRVKTASYSGG